MGGLIDRLKGFLGPRKPVAAAITEPPAQKRRATRLPCQHMVECTVAGKKFSAVMKDISLTGVRLELPKTMAAGTVVAMHYRVAPDAKKFTHKLDIDTVQAKVVWSNKTTAGLELADGEDVISRSWIYQVLRELGLSGDNVKDRRKFPRLPCSLDSQLGPVGSTSAIGKILDLSEGGCLYQGAMSVRDGTRMTISIVHPTLPPLTLEGRTIHSRKVDSSWRVGVQFAAMSNKEFLRLRRYLIALVSQAA